MTVLTTFEHSIKSLFNCRIPEKLAVAISGGVDSMVLIDLLMKIKPNHCKVFAITIDHKLRKESTEEALKVNRFLERYSLDHSILPINETINLNQLEKDARFYRFRILEDYCRKQEINNVLLAHHRDDQIETMAMRLLNNSSFFGLCGMSRRKELVKGLNVVRPMLTINKSQIYEYAYQNKLAWVEDPTNQDPDLTIRNKIRSLVARNEKLKKSLIELHDNVTLLVNSVTKSINDFEEEIEWSIDSQLGYLNIDFDLSLLDLYHPIVINRLLFKLIGKVSNDPNYVFKYRKFDSVNSGAIPGNFSLIEQLKQGSQDIQLAHCNINSSLQERKMTIKVTRQREGLNNKARCLIKANEWITFDNRFNFRFPNWYLENTFIINYNYKLHYKSIKNKRINKIATMYQLPVVVNETNELLLFPTLGGCEVDMIQRKF